MANKYILRVTAGSGYDTDAHVDVAVNTSKPTLISSPLADIELNVRVQNYTGLPRGSPETSPYFEQEPHKTNGDQYSICLRFTPKKPSPGKQANGDEVANGAAAANIEGINAMDLQFGNDFDEPIRSHLPPGFNTALRIVKWLVDPGIDGDAYADEPYLYGPALSSFNIVHCGAGDFDEKKGGLWFEEGGDEEGGKKRKVIDAPGGNAEDGNGKERMKWALVDENKQKWVWEYGKTYGLDFFNPYLDFNSFALRLPGFQLGIMKYWDGQGLRYVLRNKKTKDVYLVVLFTLYLREDVRKDGSLKVPEEVARRNAAAGRRLDTSQESTNESKPDIPEIKQTGASIDDVD